MEVACGLSHVFAHGRLEVACRLLHVFAHGREVCCTGVLVSGACGCCSLLSALSPAAQAQGGEFPVVLVALHNCAGRALRRQLFYTAVSRAQLLLVVVGTDASIDRCLKHTGLDHHAEESSRFRLKLHSARVEAGLPRIQKAVYGPEGWS